MTFYGTTKQCKELPELYREMPIIYNHLVLEGEQGAKKFSEFYKSLIYLTISSGGEVEKIIKKHLNNNKINPQSDFIRSNFPGFADI